MYRREWLAAAGLASATLAMNGPRIWAGESGGKVEPKSFQLKYAPHFGMFKNLAGQDPIDQLKFAADYGFRAWEDNGMMRKPVELQEKIAATMDQLDIEMGVFVSFGKGSKTDFVEDTSSEYQDFLRKEMKKAVECAKRVNAKWTTVVPAQTSLKLEIDYQTANCIENLKVMAEVCEPSGLVMVLEPLNWWANHPGFFLSKIPQAYLICQAVGSPSCKILDDLYHQQITEGNLIPNLDKAWEEIAYIQVGDNPGRDEPGTGEINYRNIFEHLHAKGYDGIVGMEHGNSMAGKEGEWAVIRAYQQADSFK